MNNCLVKDNCLCSFDCDWCKNYEEYVPINKSILSPLQVKNKEERKEKRKIKKISDASKRGRANRRNGRRAEKEIEDILNELGLHAIRTPMSGALKCNNLVQELKSHVAGDIRIMLEDRELIVECKRNIHSDSWYKLLNEGVIYIEGFCYGLRKQLFEYLVNGVLPEEHIVVKDKKFKKLHDYFDQDNSDIVVVTKPYSEPLFFLKPETFIKIGGLNK
jgi:hypothetical protein